MRTCFSMDPLTVDPRKNGDPISSAFLFMLYDGLTRLLPDGQVELSLAESVDLSEDRCIYTFHLRKAFWSDGHPITAFDFETSWKKALSPQFPTACPQLFYPIKNAEAAREGKISSDQVRVQALDASRLRVELNHPTPYFLSLISFCNFFPLPHHVECDSSNWENLGEPNAPLVCSGPFKLSKWERKKEIEVIKNSLYWDAENTDLPSIHISIVNDEYTVLEMFENEELDWVSFHLSPIPVSALKRYSRDERFSAAPMGGTLFCAFNLNRFPFNNENIRRAFSCAIDRPWITEQTSQSAEMAALRFIPPVMDKTCLEIPLHFDPKRARRYLQQGLMQLGILKSEDETFDINHLNIRLFLSQLTLTYDNSQSSRNVAQALQENWGRALGFRVQLVQQDFKTQLEKIAQGDYNLALRVCMAQYNDPLSFLERFKYKYLSRNFPKFQSSEYIDLLDRAAKEYDFESRKNLLQAAEAHLLDKMPLSPIYHLNYPILCNPSTCGVELSPIGGVQFRRAKCVPEKSHRKQFAVS